MVKFFVYMQKFRQLQILASPRDVNRSMLNYILFLFPARYLREAMVSRFLTMQV